MGGTQAIDWSKYEAPASSPQIDFSKYETSEPSTSEKLSAGYEKATRGYNPSVEDWAQNHPVVGPIMRFLDATGGAAIKSPEMLKDALVEAVKSQADPRRILDPLDVMGNYEKARDIYKSWSDPNVRHAALSVLPEALGQGTGQVAGAEIGGKAGEVVGPKITAISDKIPSSSDVGLALRTERGALKPGIRTAAKAVGAGAGALVGGGWGAMVGEHLGEGLARTIIPERPTNIPTKVDPGAPLPSAEESYAARGAEADRIRKMQDVEARRQAKITAQQQKSPLVTPQSAVTESEGRPATWTNETVMELASHGDARAIQQARLRKLGLPPNAGLVANKEATITPSVGTPKSVTVFDANGRPITGAENYQPNYIYRARDVGEQGIPADQQSHAHATSSLEQAQDFANHRGEITGKPQEVIRVDTNKINGGDFWKREFEPGVDWYKFHRPVPESAVEVVSQHEVEK